MHGGGPGQRGSNFWIRKQPDGTARKIKMKPSGTVKMGVGDIVIIHTPGGGGYGTLKTENSKVVDSNDTGTGADGTTEKVTPVAPDGTSFVPRANGSVSAWSAMQETN
jgi:5-oxoprolinase (ATP-hydrolysing)